MILQDGRLAGAVGPDDADLRAREERQRDVVEDDLVAVGLARLGHDVDELWHRARLSAATDGCSALDVDGTVASRVGLTALRDAWARDGSAQHQASATAVRVGRRLARSVPELLRDCLVGSADVAVRRTGASWPGRSATRRRRVAERRPPQAEPVGWSASARRRRLVAPREPRLAPAQVVPDRQRVDRHVRALAAVLALPVAHDLLAVDHDRVALGAARRPR